MKTGIFKITLAMALIISLLGATACVGGGLKYDDPYAKYKLEEYVTIGEYEGIEITKPVVTVSKEEVKSEIDARVAEKTTEEHIKEGVAESGDKVNISYVGKKDGVAFEGGSTGKDGTEIILGASGYIPGFDDGVVGMKVGDTKDLNLKFPEDYHEASLAGADVVFTVTLNYKSVPKTIEYDLDFVKSVSKAKSKEEYEDMVKKELEEKKELRAKDGMYASIWEKIMTTAEIKKYPNEEVKRSQEEVEKQLEQYAMQYGVTADDFVKNMMQMSKEEYKDYTKEQAKEIVAQDMVFSVLVKREKITLSQKEYDEKIEEFKKQQGIDEEAFKNANGGKSFEESVDKNRLIKAFLLQKLCEDALSKAKVK